MTRCRTTTATSPFVLGRDRRYSIRREYCGYSEARWVARFLGEWIGQSLTKPEVRQMALQHHTNLTA